MVISPAAALAAPPEIGFPDILEAVKPQLPMSLRFYVDDPGKLRGTLAGDTLRLEALPPFVYDSLRKQDILQLFSTETRRLTGREMRVQLSELKPGQREVRDLEELRRFPEVSFTERS